MPNTSTPTFRLGEGTFLFGDDMTITGIEGSVQNIRRPGYGSETEPPNRPGLPLLTNAGDNFLEVQVPGPSGDGDPPNEIKIKIRSPEDDSGENASYGVFSGDKVIITDLEPNTNYTIWFLTKYSYSGWSDAGPPTVIVTNDSQKAPNVAALGQMFEALINAAGRQNQSRDVDINNTNTGTDNASQPPSNSSEIEIASSASAIGSALTKESVSEADPK